MPISRDFRSSYCVCWLGVRSSSYRPRWCSGKPLAEERRLTMGLATHAFGLRTTRDRSAIDGLLACAVVEAINTFVIHDDGSDESGLSHDRRIYSPAPMPTGTRS